jgi:hypothetical protein
LRQTTFLKHGGLRYGERRLFMMILLSQGTPLCGCVKKREGERGKPSCRATRIRWGNRLEM